MSEPCPRESDLIALVWVWTLELKKKKSLYVILVDNSNGQ